MRLKHRYLSLSFFSVTLLIVLAFGVSYVRAQSTDSAELELGAQVYAENCAVCHGLDGEGRVGATLAQNWPSIRPDLRIRATIVNGVPGSAMPAWSQANGGPLSDEELDALVVYILNWETGGPRLIPSTPTPFARQVISPIPGVAGDPNRGAQLYDENCVVCHGADGEGRVGAALARDWSAIRPDLRVRSTIAAGVPGSPMPGWSQANGGPLTESEIDDLTAFVLGLPDLTPVTAPTQMPELNIFLTGWGGVLVFLILFVLVVVIAILVQSRGNSEQEG